MKKQLLIMLAASTMLASCSMNESELPGVTPPDVSEELPVPITLSAGVEASTAPQSRALTGDKFPATTNNVFGVTAYSGSAVPTDWTKTYFNNISVNSGAASALSLATAQYYPANGDKVYFYAYAPTLASITTVAASATAAYTLTGQEDILWAKVDKGIAKPATAGATQEQPELQFAHKLMKLTFKLVKDVTFQGTAAVTNITVKETRTAASLNIGTGVLTFTDVSADKTVKLDLTANNGIDGRTLTETLMVQPAASVKLSIVAGGVTYPDVTITLTGTGAGQAGTSHLITLTFKQNAIVPTAAITPWVTTGSGASDMI